MKALRNILLPAAILFFVAASYRKAVKDLQVQVSDFSIDGDSVTIQLRVTNPNVNPFYVSGANLDIFLDDVKVGVAQLDTPVYLEPNGIIFINPVVTINRATVATTVAQIILGQMPLQVTVQGTVKIGVIDVPVNFTTSLAAGNF